jgi:uncharacterized protein (TIGR02246 family)
MRHLVTSRLPLGDLPVAPREEDRPTKTTLEASNRSPTMSAAEIAANNRAFEHAVETANVDAIANLLAPDVIALPPDGPIVAGKEAVKQLWMSPIREHGMKSCRISSETLDVAGDMATEVGHATMTMAPPSGKAETARIKFVVVWKRLGGQWLMHRDIWNTAA